MHICYVDEAGCTGELPAPFSSIQPIFVVAGVVIDQTRLRQVTHDFLELKQKFFPNAVLKGSGGLRPATYLEWVMAEIKGSEIRKAVCAPNRDKRRHAFSYIDQTLGLFEKHQIRILGKLFVKNIAVPMNGKSVYTSSIQGIFASFHNLLTRVNDEGIVIIDSRLRHMNVNVSYSIFTSKFKQAGDDHSRVSELPTFGHSENHVGLQLADFLCSSLLFPMAAYAYCTGILTNDMHVKPGYSELRSRYGIRISQLQHRYPIPRQAFRDGGGIVVSDSLTKRSGSLLFKPQRPSLPPPTVLAALPPPRRPGAN